ncbi:MAG: DegV family EDD domain-containing protein [Lachnospiraceae bacterium]|nr:DegV family EDD domain-containing protein [Lachnospiraceae bacterium]
MNLTEWIKSAIHAVKDPERDFSERIFLILSLASEAAMIIALIGDLCIKENPFEIAVITGTLIVVPIISLLGLHFDKLKIAIRTTVICLVFIILPALFFFGGGVKGGGVIWIIYAFIYVGLLLRGTWRNVMFSCIAVFAMICYFINYYYPWLVYRHSISKFYVDNLISLILVGVLSYIMTWSQGQLFKDENERAKKAAEKAEELTRSQNRFFSSMSHEIRTPINSILGLNELILRDEYASDDIVRDASGIQGSGKMLLSLINDILDFSKIEAGSMDIVPVDYKIGDMLSEIVNMLWLRAHDKGLSFEVSVDPDVPMVLYGDEVRIKQVIINLLNNAVKYTKEGSVELRIESREPDNESVELVISISDTGMGIKKEDIPYLFDAFKRVDEGKNRHIEGTGLGLSIVKQLVELMDGNVTVNSVYGEGTTFTVVVKQGVSDHTRVGELNIHNQQVVRRSAYESSFLAPEVRILIVDDNEMNLEVERRLLEDTDMGIDTALNGKEALEKSQKVHYDAIFMDHLMPEMDGIECLECLRNQQGGLNRNTPVIVLTANAGSENKELYNRAGFDGYLVKPVSGEAMEETLIKHISSEKIILRSVMLGNDEEIHASEGYADKVPVIITSSNMCDLPESLIRKLHIPIIPFVIKTEEGVFKDGVHMDANELIRHISAGKEAVSFPPDEAAYTDFFAEILKRTHHIIHISITTSMSEDYARASEAAKSFDNVTVINSECLSSATGILVMIACKLVQQGMQAQEIIAELEVIKHRLRCSFVIDNTEYMARKGLVSMRLHKFAESFNLHPALRIREDKAGLGGIWFGRTRRAYKKYIHSALPPDTIPESEVVFITYVDVPLETLTWIEEEIRKTAYFEHVIFQQASAAISSNCGPGTVGILYMLKSNKTYNIASFIDSEVASREDLQEEPGNEVQGSGGGTADEASPEEEEYLEEETGLEEGTYPEEDQEETEKELQEEKWYDKIKGIDAKAAIQNSGSEEAFKAVVRIFYDSIQDKHGELEGSFTSGDWENYTIKIHALKSSARLVGAMELGREAELLEAAGKEGNISYIEEHHASVMEDYLHYKEAFAEVFEQEAEGAEEGSGKPEADEFLMESIYEELRDAAENMDCDRIEAALQEIGEYAIPAKEKDRFALVCEKADLLDYEGMLQALEK